MTMADDRTRKVGRRTILKAGLAGAGLAGAVAAPSVLRAQSPRRLTMVTAWPANAPGVGVNAQRCADMINLMSGGRLEIRVYAAGELVAPFECFDAVQAGTADMAHATPYYWASKSNALHFFTGVPFGLTATEHTAWLLFGGGQDLWRRAYEPFGIVSFYAGSSGAQASGWFRREINSVDDLSGLTMRIAGLGGEAMRRLGVNVVLTPAGEIFQAMQSGTIDAAEWIGPWNDRAFGLFRVARYYYMPAFHEFGPALELMINRSVFEDLDEDLQEIVRRAAMASATETLADFTYHNTVSLDPLMAEEDVELKTFPDDVVMALGQASEEVLAEVARQSDLAGEIYESFLAFRVKSARYAEVSEAAVLKMRRQGLPPL